MRWRLRRRWLRAKAWRLARNHYMFGFTVVALAVAAAGALGYFDGNEDAPRPRPQVAAPPTRTPVPFNTAAAFIPPEPLRVTYYIVDTVEERDALNAWESETIFREILARDAIEVLLVRTPEEEAAAQEALRRAETLAEESGFILIVQDLRE